MRNTFIFTVILFFFSTSLWAENWDYIRDSGEYYWGVGQSESFEEAERMAKSELIGQIVSHVSSSFVHVVDETNTNGDIDSKSRMESCVKTYSAATLTNMKPMHENVKNPPYICRYYIKRSEVERIFRSRIEKAKTLFDTAGKYLENRKIDQALRGYYDAYSLVRSLQYPNEAKDADGNLLIVTIPNIIEEILADINVAFDKRSDDNYVEFLFTYKGEPVSSLEFSCNNGQQLAVGLGAKNGRGGTQVFSSHPGKVYHIEIEYVFETKRRGDDELNEVLKIVSKPVIGAASKKVFCTDYVNESDKSVLDATVVAKAKETTEVVNAYQLKPKDSQLVKEYSGYKVTMDAVLNAVASRSFTDVANLSYFTLDGLDEFERLVSYGSGRVVGVPKIDFFKGLDSCVVARGLNMSFAFDDEKKQTFVEDVIFYLDKYGKIDNVTFGLGIDVTNGILTNPAPGWSDDAREVLLEFLENYKTAYALEDINYIESVFADNAHIIVGKVLKTKPGFNPANEKSYSIAGKEAIQYSHLTKSDYMKNLKRVFASNEFININFLNVAVRKITKDKEREKYVIQLEQEYTSSNYSDRGYLMLLVDITDKEEPLIEIRTWQPDVIDMDKVFHEGMFY